MSNITCFQVDEETVNCSGIIYALPEAKLTPSDKEFWIYLAIYVALVLAAGLMSGLTMGLLSLDVLTLKVMRDGGSASEKKHAQKILPIVQRHHLLLVTLLLGNAAAVEAMPIFLDRISDPVTAILVSVTAVLIFGEVIPQAICTRFGLAIGACLAPLVYILMGLFFIVAWPLSKLLDCLLGKDHSTFFRRAELKVLVDLHGSNTGELHGNQEHLTTDEVVIIKGALDMKNKTVKDAMVPLDSVYMLAIDRCMDSSTMTELMNHAHSRIPIYEGSRENIISLLLVKTLIHLDPDDATPIKSLIDDGMARPFLQANEDKPLFDMLNEFQEGKVFEVDHPKVLSFWKGLIHLDPDDATPIQSLIDDGMARPFLQANEDKPLFDMLNEFQEGKGHLAVVKSFKGHNMSTKPHSQHMLDDNPNTPLLSHDSDDDEILDINEKTTGIITLEDVLEELIQEEIYDETDVYVDIKRQIQVARARAAKISNNSARASHRKPMDRSLSHPPLRKHVVSVAPDLITVDETEDGEIQNNVLA